MTKTDKIIASMREAAFDVNIGVITPAEWVQRYDLSVDNGVTFPEQLAALREQFATKEG